MLNIFLFEQSFPGIFVFSYAVLSDVSRQYFLAIAALKIELDHITVDLAARRDVSMPSDGKGTRPMSPEVEIVTRRQDTI